MIPIRDTLQASRTPLVNYALIALCALAFARELAAGPELESFVTEYALVPARFSALLARHGALDLALYAPFVSSMFLHAGVAHFVGNMLFLWIFGDNVEDRLGHVKYLLFYLLCGLGASAAHIYFNWGSRIPSVGASGAIAGVLAGYLLLFPSATIRTLIFLGWFPVMTRVPALIMIGFWFVTQLLSGVAALGQVEQTSGVAFWAHIGGFVIGLPLALLMRRPQRTGHYSYR